MPEAEATPTIRKQVADLAAELIRKQPTGIRWSELHQAIREKLNVNPNTATGSLRYFANHLPGDIYKADRGVYAVVDPAEQKEEAPQPTPASVKVREQHFYEPFAAWLVGELEEATKAVAIGGNGAGGKWGTPDVIGLYSPRKTDPIQFTEEVVAVEIKIDTQSLITAFGQACAYRLFAHRVYIAVPQDANPRDLKRLDALAVLMGIGLVKFNADKPEAPDFSVMVRASKHEPDYYYTNEILSTFRDELGL
ncbi:hypothetical protein [Cognatilysobacter segetis]|uniref:hypothetical protein n=1 Tax=Cognatilysobacter segetis TaxID=2492394 RepID=UPI001061E7C3|nr:hypothetical protein [Lysobacter segetis]